MTTECSQNGYKMCQLFLQKLYKRPVLGIHHQPALATDCLHTLSGLMA